MEMESLDSDLLDKKLLAVVDLANVFDCSERHIFRLLSAGKIPEPVRIGSLLRWDRKKIFEWVSAGCPDCREDQANG
jgi:predicted DNA-binding transcriptional regulator AlpA